jgi:hypothetical protein
MVGPPGDAAGRSGSGHHIRYKASMVGPMGDAVSRTDSSHHCLAVVVGVDVIDGMPLRRQYRSQE